MRGGTVPAALSSGSALKPSSIFSKHLQLTVQLIIEVRLAAWPVSVNWQSVARACCSECHLRKIKRAQPIYDRALGGEEDRRILTAVGCSKWSRNPCCCFSSCPFCRCRKPCPRC